MRGAVFGRFDGWAAPVVGVVRVHDKLLSRWGNAGEELPDTLLGFEATGPLSLRPDCGKPEVVPSPGLGVGVLSPQVLVVGCGV